MSIRQWVADTLFGDVIDRRVREATAGEEDRWWQSLNARQAVKDVSWQDFLDQQEDSLLAYRSNPLAYRIVELMTDYVLGKGVSVAAKDKTVDAWLQTFWNHALNRMPARLHQWCTELSLAGELFVTFHTNLFDGMTYVRALPASLIVEIETNPNDVEDELRFRQASRVGALTPTLSQGERGQEERWWDPGDMKHYAVNRVVGAVRGQGDLVPVLPWLRRYKDWLTDRVVINKYKGAYLWDITLQGATAAQIKQKQAELAAVPPSPGSFIVHNEGEVWQAIQPSINAESVEADGHALRLAIGAGAGVPLHYLAEGTGATRATAAEMGEPTRRHYEKRQMYVAYLVTDVCERVLRRAQTRGALPRSADLTLLPVEFPDLTVADNSALAQAVAAAANGLAVAVERGWLDDEAARGWLYRFADAKEATGSQAAGRPEL